MDYITSQAKQQLTNRNKVYKITKIACGKYSETIPNTDKQGWLLTSEAEQDTQWAKHFSEILNKPSPRAEIDLDFNIVPPEKEEIISTIRFLKNKNKAPG